MKDLRKLTRIHTLHERILKQKEAEQKQHAEQLLQAEARLRELAMQLQETERLASIHSANARDALEWHRYKELLLSKQGEQEKRVNEWKEILEVSREETKQAYQEKEKWRMYQAQVLRAASQRQNAAAIKQADELAMQRFAERNRTGQ